MDNDLAYGGVERSEELVFSEDITLAQDVHQCGLPDVRIADEGDTYELASILALHGHLSVDALELLLEVGDTILYETLVGL